jgi:hypothetical protein
MSMNTQPTHFNGSSRREVFRTLQVIMLISMTILCARCGDGQSSNEQGKESEPSGTSETDPKEKELASIPVGIEITHSPNPVKAQLGGRSGHKYTWVYRTTVRSTTGPLKVQEFGAFSWVDGRWVFSTYTGKPFTSQDFADWYSCPNAVLESTKQYADPTNWSGATLLEHDKTRWYVIAVNDKGERFKGEAVVEQLAETVEDARHPAASRSAAHENQARENWPDCGCKPGELHEWFCLKERCPFCGGQLASCDCITRELHLSDDERAAVAAYEDDSVEPLKGIMERWKAALNAKGRVPC